MSYGELVLPPVYDGVNRVTGRFMKGHIPANKGKKWDEYMSKRSQRRCRKGWNNLDQYRPKKRPDTAGRCRRTLVAVMDDGTWKVFGFSREAVAWMGAQGVMCNRENIGRCARLNESNRRRYGVHPPSDDHRYKGVRWYYDDNSAWMRKIKNI